MCHAKFFFFFFLLFALYVYLAAGCGENDEDGTFYMSCEDFFFFFTFCPASCMSGGVVGLGMGVNADDGTFYMSREDVFSPLFGPTCTSVCLFYLIPTLRF